MLQICTTEREMAALQLAIVERNIHLMAALMYFVLSRRLDFTDTIRRVIRRILTIQTDLQQQTLSGRSIAPSRAGSPADKETDAV